MTIAICCILGEYKAVTPEAKRNVDSHPAWPLHHAVVRKNALQPSPTDAFYISS